MQWRIVSSICAAALGVACGSGDQSVDQQTQAASPRPPTAFVWNGSGARAYGGDELGGYSIEATQNRQAGGSTSAWLNYFKSAVDPTSYVCETVYLCRKCRRDDPTCTPRCDYPTEYCRYTRYSWEYGWGSIAAGDLDVSGHRARLQTTVAASDAFWIERCEVDEVAFTWNCTQQASGGGAIDLEWISDRTGEYRSSGVNDYRAGKYAWHYSGTSTEYQAKATGSFLGSAVDGYGSMGSGVNVSVSRAVAERN